MSYFSRQTSWVIIIETMTALGIAYLSVLAKLREYKDQGDSLEPSYQNLGPRCKGALISLVDFLA